jgi:hypothetical protein
MSSETHVQVAPAPHAIGQPCKCDQQFGDAVPLLLIVFVFLLGADRIRAFLRSRKEKSARDAEGRES